MTATADTMKISAAQQSAILSHYTFDEQGRVRLRSTHKTEPLLRLAGAHSPVALETYAVPVRRDDKGFLVIDTKSATIAPVAESDDALFEAGGIFSRQTPTAEHSEAVAKIQPQLDILNEFLRTRTFEIATGPDTKVRVQIVGFSDRSLPTPCERAKWEPTKPTDTDVHAAVDALRLSRRLADLEQL